MDAIVHATFTEFNHDVYQQPVYLPDNVSMETSYDRLLKAASIMKGWNTPSEIARGLTLGGYKVSAQVMTNWKNRGTVSIEGMTEIARIIGCLYEWLKNGTEPMEGYLSSVMRDHFAQQSNVQPAPDLTGKVPLISWVQAGQFCNAPDLLQPGDAEDWIPTLRKYGPHAYALRVVGDSMVSPNPAQASYHPGLLIIVDPDRAITNGSRVVARISGTEEATFKVYAEDAGKRYLRPLNPQYPTITMTEDMMICGVVVGSWRDE